MKRRLYLFLATLFLSIALQAGNHEKALTEIGYWLSDADGLPSFVFTGSLPSIAIRPDGVKANLPDDPYFLLGNYRLTVFAHTSGIYELISGEREWARMNSGDKVNSGDNRATLEILNGDGSLGKQIQLVGMQSVAADREACAKIFGCGYAKYSYHLDGLDVERNLQVAPSTKYDNGISAMLLNVSIKNNGRKSVILRYTETVRANYKPIFYQRSGLNPLHYQPQYRVDGPVVSCEVKVSSPDPLMIPESGRMSIYDGYPPILYLKALSQSNLFYDKNGNLSASSELKLRKGEKRTLTFIVGYSFNPDQIKEISADDFSTSWHRVLPAFPEEQDKTLSRELVWHAYTLEAMATYSQYYKETKIPQGMVYDYYRGQHAAARDNYQHAMPLIYYNPALCKSVMRYMSQRITPSGDVRLIEYGYGYADNMQYYTSDQQLFFFQLMAEYLRVTGDTGFLGETVCLFPAETGVKVTMLEILEKCFSFLRYHIGVGNHGLIRLLNSDWNDHVYVMNPVAYNKVLFSGESMMNTTMAIAILQNLIPSLERVPEAASLVESMRIFEREQKEAFLNDLGDRVFPRRMYFEGKPIGEEDMWLEPLGYMLQIKDFQLERKQRLYEAMVERLYRNEKLGARQQEAPQGELPWLEKGSRENGGFWYSLNGPVIAGMKTVNETEAWRLLKMMSMDNMSKQYPHYWSSYWSASDTQESSLMGALEGLPDQSLQYWYIPVYCAHPHAWILYCYYRLKETT